MKFFAVASAFLLAGSAIAAPNTAKRFENHRRRANARHQGLPNQRLSKPNTEASNNTNVDYSSNWAGAVLVGSGYKSVTGTFTVPTPSTTGSGSAWVGIDGDTCQTAILQTGIDWTKSGSSITYDAWYEWYPGMFHSPIRISANRGTFKLTPIQMFPESKHDMSFLSNANSRMSRLRLRL